MSNNLTTATHKHKLFKKNAFFAITPEFFLLFGF